MKCFNIYFVALFTLIFGCAEQTQPTTTTISVIIDQTEGDNFAISSDIVLGEFHNSQLHDGIELSLIPITDTRYPAKQSFVMEQGKTGWLANDHLRRKQKQALFKRFSDSSTVFNANTQVLEHSEIFRVIANELNYLAAKTGNRKLIVSSDLKEYSSLYSVYDTKKREFLINNSEEIASIFESSVELSDDLSGITIQLLYKPTHKDAELYSKLVWVYTSIFESRGAKVTVGYHNTINI